MRKTLFAIAAIFVASLSLAGTAQAQDDVVVGTVVADPATVSSAGEYTLTATGSEFIPDSSVLLVACVSPADLLVPGASSLEEIVAAAGLIDPLADCDIAAAQNVDVDGDGGWSADLTAEVGDNFFLSAGALDGSQVGATWIPIVTAAADAEPAEEEAAEEEAAEEEAAEEEAAEEEPAEEEAAEESAEEEAAEEPLAETGVETGLLAVVGAAVLGAGVLVTSEGRRFRK